MKVFGTFLIVAIGIAGYFNGFSQAQSQSVQLSRIETAITTGFASLRNTSGKVDAVYDRLTALENKLDLIYRRTQEGNVATSSISTSQASNFPGTFTPVDTSNRVQKLKLRFKVWGRNLPDKDTGVLPSDTSDSYYEWYVSTDGGATKKKMKKSDTINDSENPDWGNIMEFDFDRSKNQWWFFYVGDHDNLREDDTVGRAWVNVADYVDKGQSVAAKLDKQSGYIVIQSADKQMQPNFQPGQLPMPVGMPDTSVLRFQVSAQNLPTKDDIGFIPGRSDPYVIIRATDGLTGKERDVGRSGTVTSSSNPVWGDVFQFQWNKKNNQWLRFTIYDDDTLREDDKLANAWIEVNDFVAKGQVYTLILPKKGTMTVRRL